MYLMCSQRLQDFVSCQVSFFVNWVLLLPAEKYPYPMPPLPDEGEESEPTKCQGM